MRARRSAGARRGLGAIPARKPAARGPRLPPVLRRLWRESREIPLWLADGWREKNFLIKMPALSTAPPVARLRAETPVAKIPVRTRRGYFYKRACARP